MDKRSGSEVNEKISKLHELIGDVSLILTGDNGKQSLKDFEYAGDLLAKTFTMGTYEGELNKTELLEANRLWKKYKEK